MGCFADPTTGRSKTGYSHDAQCVNYRGPDERYRRPGNLLRLQETALSIADVTDKKKPKRIAMAEYPNVGYTHQGWLTEDQRYFYMNDELDELKGWSPNTRTLVWDLSELEDPVLAKEFLVRTRGHGPQPLRQGRQDVPVELRRGPARARHSESDRTPEVGYFDTVPFGEDGPRFGGSWSNYPFFKSGTIAVTSMSEGLFLLRYREADRPIS